MQVQYVYGNRTVFTKKTAEKLKTDKAGAVLQYQLFCQLYVTFLLIVTQM